MSGKLTDQLLAIMTVNRVSISQLATELGCDELRTANILFRREACSPAEAATIAQVLGLPDNYTANLTKASDPGSFRFSEAFMLVFDKLILGVVAALIIFFFQQQANLQKERMAKAESVADRETSIFEDQQNRLTQSISSLLENARLAAFLIGEGRTDSDEFKNAISFLGKSATQIEIVMATMNQVMKPSPPEKTSEEFLKEIHRLRKDLSAKIEPEDLDDRIVKLIDDYRVIFTHSNKVLLERALIDYDEIVDKL